MRANGMPEIWHRQITRRNVLAGALGATGVSGLLAIAGCGGGGNGNSGQSSATIATGSSSGTFDGSQIGPSPGSTYISTATIFQIKWPDAALPPPSTFTASLIRYQEARGNASRNVGPQNLVITPVTGAETWNISRAGGATLDTEGVYYLQFAAPGLTTIRAAYIVASGRSVPIAGGRSISTGQNGSLSGVVISPDAGTVFLPQQTTFTITWPSGTTPPASFDVNLVRYQEPAGGDDLSVTTQAVTVTAAGTNTWNVARQSGASLDAGGTYYLEIAAAGETAVRAAYIVSVEQ